mgnify:CR=1 FL=1
MVSLAENWKLAHTLGDKPPGTLVDGDVVSAVEFDEPSGQYLATGDRGGRVRIYERNDISERLADALPRLQGLVDAFLAAPPRDYSKGDCVQEGGSCEGSATPYAPFPHMPVCMHAAPPPRRKGPRLAAPWKVKGGKEF